MRYFGSLKFGSMVATFAPAAGPLIAAPGAIVPFGRVPGAQVSGGVSMFLRADAGARRGVAGVLVCAPLF